MGTIRIVTLGMLGAGAVLLATAALAQPGARPVRYGLNGPELDGCTPYSEIRGLNPRGDNFVSVRAAPTTRARASWTGSGPDGRSGSARRRRAGPASSTGRGAAWTAMSKTRRRGRAPIAGRAGRAGWRRAT